MGSKRAVSTTGYVVQRNCSSGNTDIALFDMDKKRQGEVARKYFCDDGANRICGFKGGGVGWLRFRKQRNDGGESTKVCGG